MPERRRAALALCTCLVAAAACSAPWIDSPLSDGAAATPTPRLEAPTPLPEPRLLVVCLAEEPNTLYLHGNPNASARTLFPLLYDGPFDLRAYRVEPVILEAAPSAEAGTVRVEPVDIVSGDLYFNPATQLAEQLRPGKVFLPSGCTSASCQRVYQGGGATLDRMVVDFRLVEGLQWSDGRPLTAGDSVFSYRLDSSPDTPSLKDQVNRTSSYRAIDERTIQWTGIPGFFDPEAATNFWTPLPEHLLGEVRAADLPAAEEAARRPVGWGPYRIERWEPGEAIEFVPNPNYRGTTPYFERVMARFLDGAGGEAALQQVITGECDVLEESLVAVEDLEQVRTQEAQGRLQLITTPGVLVERLDFSLRPSGERPDILADKETRRALAQCIDRQRLIDLWLPGLSPIPSSYLTPDHPLAAVPAAEVTFDPAAGREALAQLGWVESDADAQTARSAQGVAGVPGGTRLALSLATAADEVQLDLAQAIAADLAVCGVEVTIESRPGAELFAPWPDGPVFGRQFDLVLWPWLQWQTPACEAFVSGEIASAENPEGINASGFSDPAYDGACAQVAFGELTGESFRQGVEATQAILAEAVPSLALFQWPRLLVAAPGVCGFELDPTVASPLWNIEALRSGPDCGS
jgi:peptide/nickel transport system substrate-binding protein